ncbi:MAG: BACON domain-containing protein, partial [Verrucomicrobiota bacterium]
ALTTIPATITASYAANATSTIAVTSNTDWLVSSNQVWALVGPVSGSGNGTVTISCLANATASPRSAVISIGGQTCILTQAASPYAVWATGLAAGAQGFSQDADHDGVSNGIEYALGRDGASATGANGISQLPLITAMAGHLTMVLNLPDPAPVDIVYDVQVANDLTGTWTTIIEKSETGPWTAVGNSGATVVSAPGGSGRILHTITDVEGHHFMRLAVKSF